MVISSVDTLLLTNRALVNFFLIFNLSAKAFLLKNINKVKEKLVTYYYIFKSILPINLIELYLFVMVLFLILNISALISGYIIDFFGLDTITKIYTEIAGFFKSHFSPGPGPGGPGPDPSGSESMMAGSLTTSNSTEADSNQPYTLPRVGRSTNIAGMLSDPDKNQHFNPGLNNGSRTSIKAVLYLESSSNSSLD